MVSFFEKLKKEGEMEVEEKIKKESEKVKKLEVEEEPKKVEKSKEKWLKAKGQLAVDVYQTDDNLVIQSAIAGVESEDLDISIENDVLMIKGNREKPAEEVKQNYFYQECYWGPFSREIILPVEVDPSRAEASMEKGILTIKIPKIEKERKRKIVVKG
ncbi:Hsp20/alpha crystallin family protein [Patescibacteria group bacterium]|nr:Hsp20/alpha crystallin family protein [Patescibacteria group bacterium]